MAPGNDPTPSDSTDQVSPALRRLVDEATDAAAPASASRRRFLQVGGLGVIGAAVLAACGGPGDQGSIPVEGTSPSTSLAPDRVVNDGVLLRTASSLEHSIIDAYDRSLELDVLPADLMPAAEMFRGQHVSAAAYFEGLTRTTGAPEFSEPNPAVQVKVVDPAMKLIAENGNKPVDVAYLLFGMEQLETETYQQFVQTLAAPRYRSQVMMVGGPGARRNAVLARVIPGSLVIPAELPPPSATTTTTVVGPTTTAVGGGSAAQIAPVYQVPGAFQPLTSVGITIGITTINIDPLGPNSFIYESA